MSDKLKSNVEMKSFSDSLAKKDIANNLALSIIT